MRVRTVVAALCVWTMASPAFGATKAIRFGKLWDGDRVIANAIVIVENDRVQSVTTSESSIPSGAEVIALRRFTGIPGMIDAHTHMTYEEMKAMVDTAHQMGRKIAIHSYGPDGARDAVRAGTDTLEHATDMADATIAEMVRRNVIYVPTIDHNKYYVENAEIYKFTPQAVQNLNNYIQRNFETAQKAFKAGVKFAMGSDAVYNGFGLNVRELDWYVKLGMTSAQALQTATKNGAEMLGKEKDLGSVKPGFFADIVAVEGDPLSDIGVVLKNVRWVMKGGNVVVNKIAAGRSN